ncbi:Crp/Fnr family transcriptional regulator [Sphingomonas arantia]|uniref:Crp/Fnr family transcriptional regulator n=1 Tax=Sphingomonas arantia TaxID=1460676 RepID=A0ABW4TZ95_9SPHN
MPEESPLEARLSQHLRLTYSERDALRSLERRERLYQAGEIVVQEGEETDKLYVVASGWLHGSVQLKGGGRQVLRFYFVGDLTTTFSIAWGRSAATLTAVSATTLYELPRQAFGRLFRDHPRLGALLYGVSASEHVAMADRLTSVGRTDGITRIATLLLDIRSRLRVTDGIDGATFELPLTQQDLGDAVGLTKTHVSRSLKVLAEAGLVDRDGKIIRINDVERLSQMVDFQDRHSHVATDWLPPYGSNGAGEANGSSMPANGSNGANGDIRHQVLPAE